MFDSEINRKEIERYLGYAGHTPDEFTSALIETCVRELIDISSPRNYYLSFPIVWGKSADPEIIPITIDSMTIKSRNLTRNLRGCTRAVLLAATLGLGCDRLIRRAELAGSMTKAAVFQAAGAAMIEAYVDDVNRKIRSEAGADGLFCRPRYSPGYGDVPLSHQRDFDRILGLEKNAGIVLSDTLLMTPSKSVTAIIGLSPYNQNCILEGCEVCSFHESCEFSRCCTAN
jgi:hypothetical protein